MFTDPGQRVSGLTLELEPHSQLEDAVRVASNAGRATETRVGLLASREVELRAGVHLRELRRIENVVRLDPELE
jgi:hypothetical protein